MRLNLLSLITLTSLIVAMTGCGGRKGVRITEGNQERSLSAAPLVPNGTPMIVHVDLFARIATIRHGMTIGGEFLITENYAGEETSILKARANTGGLLTADILEGEPNINNIVRAASAARSLELANIYPTISN